MDLKKYLELQEKFSQLFYNKDVLSLKEKEEMLKTLSLSLHGEISKIVSSTNYKYYDRKEPEIDKGNVLFKTVNAFRYLLAIMNLNGITEDEFLEAFYQKDNYLHKKTKTWKLKNSDKPVVVVDIDDVLLGFREYFNTWLENQYNIEIDRDSTQYYSSIAVKEIGLSPESVFEEFMSNNELLNIPALSGSKEMLERLKDLGYEIQLLTSRPSSNLKCKYHTHQSLLDNNLYFDKLNFAQEKYIWLAKQDFYINGRFAFAIDDSPKHVEEYVSHNVHVVMPYYEYNKHLAIRSDPKSFQLLHDVSINNMSSMVLGLAKNLKTINCKQV
tara:strand:+ start:707 stop:1687 length:981 start_codon:yes stop_codon:yes gene_type:complete